MNSKYIFNHIILIFSVATLTSCNKLVSIPEPVNTITTSETFSTEANARSAIAGMYSQINTSPFPGTRISLYAGLSADDLTNFNTSDIYLTQFQTNTIDVNNAGFFTQDYIWKPIYSFIYKANSVIEGLQASATISASSKNPLIGEAKFIRAFGFFYLTNLFGDVPLVTTSAWANTSLMARTPSSKVYDQIIADLKDARALLTNDYAFSNEERTRANTWAAAALLARTYLYAGDWANAEKQASEVINNSNLYTLSSDLNMAFLKNSAEAIWQLEVTDQAPWSTYDADQLIPYDRTSNPKFYLPFALINEFESGDQRRIDWVDSTIYNDGNTTTTYYFPFKYKIRESQTGPNTEYTMVLRLAEQYLIRAEARAQNDNPDGALSDLNIIRQRAHLDPVTGSKDQILAAVAQERKMELFSEWGHRWFDLKRTGQADAVLSLIKPQWQPYQNLYPIPVVELQSDPNLTQNTGY